MTETQWADNARVSRERKGMFEGWSLAFWALTIMLSLIAGVIAAAIAVGVVTLQTAKYESRSVVLIDQPYEDSISGNADGLEKLVALRLKYAAITTTEVFATAVAEKYGLPAAEIHDDTIATAPVGSLLFTVGAISTDRKQAYQIANASTAGLIAYVQHEQASIGVKADQQIKMTLVTPVSTPIKISPKRQTGIAIVVGAVIAVLAMGLQTLRRRF